MIVVEDRLIIYILPGHYEEWVDPDFDEFKESNALREFMVRAEKNTLGHLNLVALEVFEQGSGHSLARWPPTAS